METGVQAEVLADMVEEIRLKLEVGRAQGGAADPDGGSVTPSMGLFDALWKVVVRSS